MDGLEVMILAVTLFMGAGMGKLLGLMVICQG